MSLRADRVAIEPRPRAAFAAEAVRVERSALDVSPARPWVDHVDFKAIVRRSAYVETRAARRLANLVARSVWRILGDREALAALLDDDVSDIGTLKLQARDVASLRTACVDALRDSWSLGRRQAQAEARRTRKLKMAALDTRAAAADYFQANSFRMAQNLSDGARALIQQELTRAVRVGERPEAVSRNIIERLIERGFTDYQGIDTEVDDEALLADLLDLDDPDRLPHYVNTLVRTNTFEAMNEARYAYFTDPALDGYVVAFEYSAVLDEKTTEFCRYMDGRVYAADSEVWDTHRPPGHYNCRSLLIPITKTAGWDGVESEPPEMEPAAGFARIARPTHCGSHQKMEADR